MRRLLAAVLAVLPGHYCIHCQCTHQVTGCVMCRCTCRKTTSCRCCGYN